MTESMSLTGGDGQVRCTWDDAPVDRVTHWRLEIKRDEDGIPFVVELRIITTGQSGIEIDREITLR